MAVTMMRNTAEQIRPQVLNRLNLETVGVCFVHRDHPDIRWRISEVQRKPEGVLVSAVGVLPHREGTEDSPGDLALVAELKRNQWMLDSLERDHRLGLLTLLREDGVSEQEVMVESLVRSLSLTDGERATLWERIQLCRWIDEVRSGSEEGIKVLSLYRAEKQKQEKAKEKEEEQEGRVEGENRNKKKDCLHRQSAKDEAANAVAASAPTEGDQMITRDGTGKSELRELDLARLVKTYGKRLPAKDEAIHAVRWDLMKKTGARIIPLAVSRVPRWRQLHNLYADYRNRRYLRLVPYVERKIQTVPSNSPFHHPRFCAIFADVLDDALKPGARTHRKRLAAYRESVTEQVFDENRLHDLRFVRAEEAHPQGLRESRLILKLDFTPMPSGSLAVALSSGGDVWYQPCDWSHYQQQVRPSLLRPPLDVKPGDEAWISEPHYDEFDLSKIARKIKWSKTSHDEQWKKAEDLNGNLNQIPDLKRDTFYRAMDRLPEYHKLALRMGDRQFREAVHRKLGLIRPARVDDLWMVDITKLDVIAVDDEFEIPIGRLSIALVIDARSEYRIGATISFDEDSLPAIALALRSALSSKEEVREAYGLRFPWLAGRKPSELEHDYGPGFISKDLGLAVSAMGIISTYSQKRRPRYKSQVERSLLAISRRLHELPGGTGWRPEDLRLWDYDPKRDAFVRLSDIKRYVYQILVDEHNQTHLKDLRGLTPHQVYTKGRQELEADYEYSPPDELLRVFLSEYHEVKQLTQAGVVIDGIPYTFLEDNPIYRERLWGSERLLATRDPWNAEDAYLVDIEGLRYGKLSAQPKHFETVENKSVWQVRAMQRLADGPADSDPDQQLKLTLRRLQHQRDVRERYWSNTHRELAPIWAGAGGGTPPSRQASAPLSGSASSEGDGTGDLAEKHLPAVDPTDIEMPEDGSDRRLAVLEGVSFAGQEED